MVAAYFPNIPPNELAQYTLHIPEGIDRSALGEDSFAYIDSNDTTLNPGCLLSSLDSLGSNSKQYGRGVQYNIAIILGLPNQ